MTVEQKIVKLLSWNCNLRASWHGSPMSIRYPSLFSSTSVGAKIDKIIKEADETECLVSPSEYIRECKKWFMENNYDTCN